MSSRRVVARNVIWNSAGTIVQMLAGFVVAPFLVHRLGETSYGLWILIASLTGYFANLDLGVSGSLGRNLAFYLAKKDERGVEGILNTALALLAVIGLIGLAATCGILLVFFELFEVPAHQVGEVRLALLLIGINLSVSFLLGAFDGTLWALQRFDLNNAVDIPIVILRAAATFYLVANGGGLVDLAWITLATTLLDGVIKAALSFRLEPMFRIRLGAIRWEWAKALYDYGVWYFLLSLAKNVQPQIGPTIVGNRLRPDAVTPYRIGAQLAGYGNTFMSTGTQVLTPVATALHAEDRHEEQQRLFIEGGKVCLVLSIYLFGVFWFLGEPFITLWMGARFAYAWTFLVVLALGEVLPMSQWISYGLFLGKGRHRWIAVCGLIEVIAGLALALVLVDQFGLMGVCVALAIPATLFRGVVRLVCGCRLVELSTTAYLTRAVLPALLMVTPHLAILGLLTWSPPQTWLSLILIGAISGASFLGLSMVQLAGWTKVKTLLLRKRPTPTSEVDNEREESDVVHA